MQRWIVVAPLLIAAGACKDPIGDVPLLGGAWCDADEPATVACVLDGDTVDLDACGEDDGTRVRFLGAAAPEIAHPGSSAECYGPEAAEFLTSVAEGRRVTVRHDVTCTDIYGRTLAWLVAEVPPDDKIVPLLQDLDDYGLRDDGYYEVVLNALVVRAGFAKVYDGIGADDDLRYGLLVDQAAALAEDEERGLWASDACGR
jgi:endonuclease YncB( thermonuclease family)